MSAMTELLLSVQEIVANAINVRHKLSEVGAPQPEPGCTCALCGLLHAVEHYEQARERYDRERAASDN